MKIKKSLLSFIALILMLLGLNAIRLNSKDNFKVEAAAGQFLYYPMAHDAPWNYQRGVGSGHTGIDYGGQFEVRAAASGTVVHAGFVTDWGNLIVIQHEDNVTGDGSWQTLYAHIATDEIYVEPGQQVAAGTVIGFSGTTGNSTGFHLHFELIRGTNFYNWSCTEHTEPCRDVKDPESYYNGLYADQTCDPSDIRTLSNGSKAYGIESAVCDLLVGPAYTVGYGYIDNVNFVAGRQIVLKPGFKAQYTGVGSYKFTAYIDPTLVE